MMALSILIFIHLSTIVFSYDKKINNWYRSESLDPFRIVNKSVAIFIGPIGYLGHEEN